MTPDQIAERHMLEAMRYASGALVYVCTCGEEFDDTRWHARHVAETMEASILGPSEPLAEWERELLSPYPAGLTVSEDGVALNWRGVNYVRQSEPWPTADLIVWTVNGDRGLFAKNIFGNYVAVSNGQVTTPPDYDDHENAVPVRPVPAAEFDALAKAWVTEFSDVTTATKRLLDATEALGLDE